MIRYQYYDSYIEILSETLLCELKRDIEKDYRSSILEKHQYDKLIKKLNKRTQESNSKYIAVI